jgi:hypothetical protein
MDVKSFVLVHKGIQEKLLANSTMPKENTSNISPST